jgi:hypothetical protein
MGGLKLETAFGTLYRAFLVKYLGNEIKGVRGTADLCAYFLLRAAQLQAQNGSFGMLSTNTIAQGDTRTVGLDQLLEQSNIVYRAVPSRPWPGEASIEVASVWMHKGNWQAPCVLSDKPVTRINSLLAEEGTATGNPYRLLRNAKQCFQGSIVLGLGFVLEPAKAHELLQLSPKNKDVLFPYLNGSDLNSSPSNEASRWVINFFDWPLRNESSSREGPVASDYPDCLRIIEENVKPERDRLVGRNAMATRRGTHWWWYASDAKNLYKAIRGLQRVLVLSLVNNHLGFAFVPNGQVYAHKLAVFAFDDYGHFALLQSAIHYHWAWHYSSTMRTDINYSPTSVFETYPLPQSSLRVEGIGQVLYEFRQQLMLTRQEGLTKTYNRFHNPEETSADIQKLRQLHVEMDSAVAAAYGWTDLDLDHGFHQTKQGLRYTISEAARREVLGRLLKMNHERHAEEVRQGLHEKKKSKPTRSKAKKAPSASEPSLFGGEE